MRPIRHNEKRRHAGFTLVEILVVMVIAAVLAAVTLGSYSAMRAGNRRTSCQANMSQVYRAIRLYAADYNGEVPYYDPDDTLGEGTGIGLWALYSFSDNAGDLAPVDIKPEKRYLTNPKVFHCPADIDNNQLYNSDKTEYNPAYLSYQVEDSSAGEFTYDPLRTSDVSGAAGDWQRQLLHFGGSNYVERPPTDNTIIFWCPFHRNSNGGGEDNVLFWDGTVQSLPVDQGGAALWERVPKGPVQ